MQDPLDRRAAVAEIDRLSERLRLAASHSKPADARRLKTAGDALRRALDALDAAREAREPAAGTGLTDVVKALRHAREALEPK